MTDSDGTYRILDLRPGVYTVTFALTGFSTVKREGIELPAAFTATVNAELQVRRDRGNNYRDRERRLLVDVQNVTSQRLLSKELLESIPVARSPQGFAALTPGITSQGISVTPGGVNEMQTAVHGASVSEAVWQIDGVSTAAADSVGGGNNTFRVAQVYVGELMVATGGGTAEQQFSGMVTNVIPKEGGNSFNGSLYAEFADKSLSSSNLSDELVAQGFTNESLSKISRLWDVSPAFGGRLIRDKLWFFVSYRDFGISQTRAGIYDNATPLGWVYTPDTTRAAYIKVTNVSRNARLTWQATPRNKISLFFDSAPHAFWQHGAHNPPPPSPEATLYRAYVPQPLFIASWKSPVSSRWLIEAGASYTKQGFDGRRQTPEHCMCSAPAGGPGCHFGNGKHHRHGVAVRSRLWARQAQHRISVRRQPLLCDRLACRQSRREVQDRFDAGHDRTEWRHQLPVAERGTSLADAIRDSARTSGGPRCGFGAVRPGSVDIQAVDPHWRHSVRLPPREHPRIASGRRLSGYRRATSRPRRWRDSAIRPCGLEAPTTCLATARPL